MLCKNTFELSDTQKKKNIFYIIWYSAQKHNNLWDQSHYPLVRSKLKLEQNFIWNGISHKYNCYHLINLEPKIYKI